MLGNAWRTTRGCCQVCWCALPGREDGLAHVAEVLLALQLAEAAVAGGGEKRRLVTPGHPGEPDLSVSLDSTQPRPARCHAHLVERAADQVAAGAIVTHVKLAVASLGILHAGPVTATAVPGRQPWRGCHCPLPDSMCSHNL